MPTADRWENWKGIVYLDGVREFIEGEGYTSEEILSWVRDGIPYTLEREPVCGLPEEMDMLRANKKEGAKLELMKMIMTYYEDGRILGP